MHGLFSIALLDRESEKIIHNEGLIARFWGAWFDACKACCDIIVADAVNENPFIVRESPADTAVVDRSDLGHIDVLAAG